MRVFITQTGVARRWKEISSSLQKKAKPYLRTQICYPKHFAARKLEKKKYTREETKKPEEVNPFIHFVHFYLKIKRQTKTTTKEKHVCHHRGRSREEEDDDDDD